MVSQTLYYRIQHCTVFPCHEGEEAFRRGIVAEALSERTNTNVLRITQTKGGGSGLNSSKQILRTLEVCY
jgi:hypothetical protein